MTLCEACGGSGHKLFSVGGRLRFARCWLCQGCGTLWRGILPMPAYR